MTIIPHSSYTADSEDASCSLLVVIIWESQSCGGAVHQMFVYISLLYAAANFLGIKKRFGSCSTSKEGFTYLLCFENSCADICLCLYIYYFSASSTASLAV